MHKVNLSLALVAGAVLVWAGCSGGGAGNPANRGPFVVQSITNGRGQIYPYRIRQADSQGNPTTTVLNIESVELLQREVSASNPVLPVAKFPATAVLPNGNAGNHFVAVQFSHELDVRSILSDLQANQTTNSGLTTSINLIAYDPDDEDTTVLRGRGFVGGRTFFNNAGTLEEVQAVEVRDGVVTILDPRAQGFPSGFAGDVDLVERNTFVFVADTDENLLTPDTFDPASNNTLVRILVQNSVLDTDGAVLEQEICTATTVGADTNPPDVLGFSDDNPIQISPGNGDRNIDPRTSVTVRFNKPVQPTDVGMFFDDTNLAPAPGGVSLNVTQAAATFSIIYYADPLNFGDLCNYTITPAYNLPGESEVQVALNPTAIRGLDGPTLGNSVNTSFETMEGPGIVNAPIAPDALYVGVGGPDPGIAVIDLNGYGQGTSTAEPGIPRSASFPNGSNFLNNPNVGQPGLTPPLTPGSSPLDAGSRGVLTLVEDTRGNNILLGPPLLGAVTDMQVGAPLDLVFNNEPINVNANSANHYNTVQLVVLPGNSIAYNPHPNPPKLVFPPPNPSQGIFAEEPTSSGPNNQLTQGNIPDFFPRFASGLFVGPAPPPPSPPPPTTFNPFQIRQQIGHFLYVLDRENRQILVVNSNRFTVLDTIRLTDPVDMAFSPTLGVLAVSNQSSKTVTFIDTDPRNSTFNTIITDVALEGGPTEVVWQPDGEAVLAVAPIEGTLAIIDAGDFTLARTVSGNINDPVAMAVTPRYIASPPASGVYYAYILNNNGSIAVYESGPDGANGIGFNDVIGVIQGNFPRAQSIRLNYQSATTGLWVGHVDDQGVSVVSQLDLTSFLPGQLPLAQINGGFVLPPTFRQKDWTITRRFGGADPSVSLNTRFSGTAISDILFDEMLNSGAGLPVPTPFNGNTGFPILGHSSKSAIIAGAVPYQPVWMFVALQDVGKIDVIEIDSGALVRTIDLPGVRSFASYWHQ